MHTIYPSAWYTVLVITLFVNRHVRIGGSLALGILFIFGTFYYVHENKDSSKPSDGTVTAVSKRADIAPVDTDNDGVPDWQESLSARVVDAVTVSSTTLAFDINTGEPYVPPTTLTGRFAEAFFKQYVTDKAENPDGFDKQALIEKAVSAIEAKTESKVYGRNDVTTVPDEPTLIREYGNNIVTAMQQDSAPNDDGEIKIFTDAIIKNDEKSLAKLEKIGDGYRTIIENTQALSVPASFSDLHADLLTSYEAIYTDVRAMQEAFNDPLLALSRAKRYEGDAQALAGTLSRIDQRLVSKEVFYTSDEPGALLTIVTEVSKQIGQPQTLSL